jgi:hypothetical protein
MVANELSQQARSRLGAVALLDEGHAKWHPEALRFEQHGLYRLVPGDRCWSHAR